jgi:hypothetical protein
MFSQLNAAVFVIDKALEHLAQCRGGSSLNTWYSAEVLT